MTAKRVKKHTPAPAGVPRKEPNSEPHTNAAAHGEAESNRNRMDDSPRGRILRAAAHLFLTKGYARTTVRDLAQAVGIQSGSLFHHFESKEQILESVMTEVSRLNTGRMQQAAAAVSDPVERLRALVHCELESIHGETSEAMNLLVAEWRSLNPAAQKRVLVLRDRYEKVWLEALQYARAELVPLEPFILRRLLVGITSGTATWYRSSGKISIDKLTEHILLLLLRDKR